jgi:hypothetical protein
MHPAWPNVRVVPVLCGCGADMVTTPGPAAQLVCPEGCEDSTIDCRAQPVPDLSGIVVCGDRSFAWAGP